LRVPHRLAVTVAEVVPQDEARGSFSGPTPMVVHLGHPRLVPVLAPGKQHFNSTSRKRRAMSK
jgi:hypothetical protein